MSKLVEFESKLRWWDPNEEPPRFNDRILAAFGSWRDQGRWFRPHVTIVTVKVMQEDIDGDEDVGEEMAADLNSGVAKWADLQFRVVDDDDDEPLDTYSDSFMWWTGMPMIPDDREMKMRSAPAFK